MSAKNAPQPAGTTAFVRFTRDRQDPHASRDSGASAGDAVNDEAHGHEMCANDKRRSAEEGAVDGAVWKPCHGCNVDDGEMGNANQTKFRGEQANGSRWYGQSVEGLMSLLYPTVCALGIIMTVPEWVGDRNQIYWQLIKAVAWMLSGLLATMVLLIVLSIVVITVVEALQFLAMSLYDLTTPSDSRSRGEPPTLVTANPVVSDLEAASQYGRIDGAV